MNLARPRRFPGLATLVLAAGIAFSGIASAAGYQHLEIPGSDGQPPVEAIVWSPCAAAAETQQLGPYVVRGIRDCAVSGRSLPLIVVSHGQGGTSLGHHDTAEALADAGFVVVTLNHPGDTFGDDSGAQRLDIFESRPRDVTRVISYMLERWPSRRQLDPRSIGVFGFSRGGYTALALAGATPSARASAARLCTSIRSLLNPLCRGLRSGDARVAPEADPRVRAVVVVDPLNLFDETGLQAVRIPVQLWASELGGDGVALADIEAIRSALPRAPDYHVANGAGHFAYLAPCPPAFKQSARRICEDPDGFDRHGWHQAMNAAVTAFFRQHLRADASP